MERPSGDQSTCQPSPTLERSTTREPSTSTMDIKCWPERLELKAIRFPSGDHDGYSPPSVSGTRCCPEPSAFMIESPEHRGPRPGGHGWSPGLAYAIFEPSGDQAGERPSASPRWPDPSAFMSQISGSPLRSERNAIRAPSGDHVASKSGPGDRVRRVRPVPSALMDQTSWKLSKTMRPESEVAADRAPTGMAGDALAL